MSDITLRVNSDFSGAQKAFRDLAASSSETAAKMQKFAEKFETQKLDNFIDRQKVLQASLTATRGETAALEQSVKKYDAEIERLIKSGLEPQSDAIQKLKAEQDALNQKISDAEQAEEAHRQSLAESADSVNGFVDKQKNLVIALSDTGNETSLLEKASKNYEKEIERLVSSGISPQSDAIQKLKAEQEELNQKLGEAKKAEEAHQKSLAQTTANASAKAGAIAGLTTAMINMARQGISAASGAFTDIAENGARIHDVAKSVDMTAESFQKLEYAAKKSGVDGFDKVMQNLNKTMIKTASGTGELSKYLKANNQGLLDTLTHTSSAEEAFLVLADAIDGAGSELEKSALAQAAFGDSSGAMVAMADGGSEALRKLGLEAENYGILSDEAVASSKAYTDAMEDLQAVMGGIGNQIIGSILPGITKMAEGLANFIVNIGEFKKKLEPFAPVIIGVTAALASFIAVANGSAIVTALGAAIGTVTTAVRGMAAALAANPLGLIAAVITAVLIPALIYLVKNWDTVQTYIQQGTARLEFAFKWLGSQVKEKLVIAFNAIKIAGVTLLDFIVGGIVRGVGQMLEVMGKLPFVGEMFEEAAATVNALGNAIGNMAEETRQNSAAAIEAAKAEQDAAQEALEAKLAGIDALAEARRLELEQAKAGNEEETALDLGKAEAQKQAYADVIRAAEAAGKTKAELQAQMSGEDKKRLDDYLSWKADAQGFDYERELAALQSEKDAMLEIEGISAEERLAVEESFGERLKQLQQEQAAAEKDLLEKRAGAVSSFFGGMSQLISAAGKENRAAAVAGKAFAMAEAGINSALAFTKTLADGGPYPLNLISAAGVLAAGLAQQVQIASAPLPSAETGGRFVVPAATGVDSVGMRVNPGEQIDVTPAGRTGFAENLVRVIVKLDEQVLWQSTNRGLRAGEIYEFAMAGNL